MSEIKPSSGTSMTQSQMPTRASSLENDPTLLGKGPPIGRVTDQDDVLPDALSVEQLHASSTKTAPDQGFSPAAAGSSLDDDADLSADAGFAPDYLDLRAASYHDTGDDGYTDLSVIDPMNFGG